MSECVCVSFTQMTFLKRSRTFPFVLCCSFPSSDRPFARPRRRRIQVARWPLTSCAFLPSRPAPPSLPFFISPLLSPPIGGPTAAAGAVCPNPCRRAATRRNIHPFPSPPYRGSCVRVAAFVRPHPSMSASGASPLPARHLHPDPLFSAAAAVAGLGVRHLQLVPPLSLLPPIPHPSPPLVRVRTLHCRTRGIGWHMHCIWPGPWATSYGRIRIACLSCACI